MKYIGNIDIKSSKPGITNTRNFVQYRLILVDNGTENSKNELIEGYLRVSRGQITIADDLL